MSNIFTPIIVSLLETDMYKFSMLQAMLHNYPNNEATYRFVCRNKTEIPLASLVGQLNAQLDHLCSLEFTDKELAYLSDRPYLSPDFIQFLRIFRLNRAFIQVSVEGDGIAIEATGPQLHVMLFEIYVLAIVNELYFREVGRHVDLAFARNKLEEKIEVFNSIEPTFKSTTGSPFEFFDFGLRRRFSSAWHEEVVRTLKEKSPHFKGSSNVYLAMKYDLLPIGTMAHEYLQTFQAVNVQLVNSQKEALECWVKEYRGDLGIALTDVIGMDAFLNDFDLYYAKLFDGLRHDSGDPVVWGDKAIEHYRKLKIDPKTKRLVFSDGLTSERIKTLYAYFNNKVQLGFGIGTNLTNDVGFTPLNIVMKLVSCNNQPVAKLSDSPGKTMCDDEVFLSYLRSVFNHH